MSYRKVREIEKEEKAVRWGPGVIAEAIREKEEMPLTLTL